MTGFLLCLSLIPNQLKAQESDTTTKTSAQHLIGASFSAVANTIPGASFKLFKEKFSYGYFIGSNIELRGGFTFYQASSDFNAFDKKFMFNVDVEALFVWRKFHVDLGLHNGNYAEFIQDLDERPAFIQYGSFGLGFTLPIFKKLTVDFSLRQSIALNTFSHYEGTNPLEGFLGVNYILAGTNDRFRKKNKNPITISQIISRGHHFVGIGYSGGAFNWPSDEGIPFTYTNNSIHYRYVFRDRLSFSSGLLFTLIFTDSPTINGSAKQNYNTLNGNIGARYHLGAFFTGLGVSVGSFSSFQNLNYVDRKVRTYLNPEIGFNARITKSILFEFQMTYALSVNRLIDPADISAHYILGTIGVTKKLGFK